MTKQLLSAVLITALTSTLDVPAQNANLPNLAQIKERAENGDAKAQTKLANAFTNKGDSVELPEPAVLSRLKLSGLSGTNSRRVALINNRAFVAGDESEIKIDGRAIKVRCLEVRKDSVVIQIDGTAKPKEIFLQRAR